MVWFDGLIWFGLVLGPKKLVGAVSPGGVVKVGDHVSSWCFWNTVRKMAEKALDAWNMRKKMGLAREEESRYGILVSSQGPGVFGEW